MARTAGTWLVYVLTIQGSLISDTQQPGTDVTDSMQYWITDSQAIDCRTMAIDKNLKILELDLSGLTDKDPVALLDGIARRTYGDLLKSFHRFDLVEGATNDDLVRQVSEAGLFPNASWTALDFPLWLPENVEYASRGD